MPARELQDANMIAKVRKMYCFLIKTPSGVFLASAAQWIALLECPCLGRGLCVSLRVIHRRECGRDESIWVVRPPDGNRLWANERAGRCVIWTHGEERQSPHRSQYQHLLKRGKEKKVALTACIRKFLTILNAMLRDKQPFRG